MYTCARRSLHTIIIHNLWFIPCVGSEEEVKIFTAQNGTLIITVMKWVPHKLETRRPWVSYALYATLRFGQRCSATNCFEVKASIFLWDAKYRMKLASKYRMKLAANLVLAFNLNTMHLYCAVFNAMDVLAFRLTKIRGVCNLYLALYLDGHVKSLQHFKRFWRNRWD